MTVTEGALGEVSGISFSTYDILSHNHFQIKITTLPQGVQFCKSISVGFLFRFPVSPFIQDGPESKKRRKVIPSDLLFGFLLCFCQFNRLSRL